MNDLAAQSLDLVSHELTATLESARAQLEAYVDGHAGPEGLMRCAEMLHLASLLGAEEVVTLLIERKASLDLRDSNGCTALIAACSRGYSRIACPPPCPTCRFLR